ncbi:MAG: SpoIIE family protein phosphatase [Bernardetiaceae bacterium]|nr:SpoIIE family protein phosphatase [Bernardetiaceae bacterium]
MSLCFMCLMGLWLAPPLLSQSVRFSQLSVTEGLSNNSITAAIQDKQGFLWFGTQEGLNRYDGYTFLEYKSSPVDSLSLSDNRITALVEDDFGYLWVGTQNGLNRYNAYTNTFENISPELFGNLRLHKYITAIFIDNKKNLWIGSKDGVFRIFLNKQGNIEGGVDLYADNEAYESISQVAVSSITADKQNRIWISTQDKGLFKIDSKASPLKINQFTPSTHKNFPDTVLQSLFYEKTTNKLWIGSTSGIFLLDTEDSLHRIERPSALSRVAKPIMIAQDKEGKIWIGTAQEGLYGYDGKGGSLQSYKKSLYNSDSFNDEHSVNVFLEDHTGILWFGTNSGINKYNPHTIKFKHYSKENQPNTLIDNDVTSFFIDGQDRLWIGTKQGGVLRSPPTGERGFYKYYYLGNGLPSNHVTGVCQDKYGTIWVATQNRGVCRFSYQNGQLNPVYYKRSRGEYGLPTNQVTDIFTDKTGEVWVLTADGSLSKYDRAENDFVIAIQGYENEEEAQARVYQNQKGEIWVATSARFYCIDPHNQNIIHQIKNQSKADVYAICETADTAVWIGTSKGLFAWNTSQNTIEIYNRKSGLTSDVVVGLEKGRNHTLWISTNRGLSCLNIETRSFKNYDNTNGLQSNRFNIGASYAAADGKLFFGGTNGYNAFYPEEIENDTIAPRVVFTDFQVFGRSVIFSAYPRIGERPTINAHITKADSIFLTHEKNAFSLEFAGLHFNDPQKVQYRYMMEGLDQDWTEVNAARRFVSFPNLPYGEYRFRVEAANPDGVWTNEGHSIYIKVIPPFWERTWFKWVAILLVVSIISAFYANRVWRIKKQKANLERVVQERTKELAEKNTQMLDSIRYAETIQNAILPPASEIQKYLPDSFTLFLPRDIVSGDFYWFKAQGEYLYLAVIDCTGHGVPGAFMSMIGSSLLNDIVSRPQAEPWKPAEILEELNSKVREALRQEDDRNSDGMDICFCRIHAKSGEILFTGAKRPLYYTDNGTIIEVKGDRKSVGGKQKKKYTPFQNKKVKVPKGEMFYLTTDGFIDQPNETSKRFGTPAFKEKITQIAYLNLNEQHKTLKNSLKEHQKNASQRDDICVIGVRAHI